MFKLPLSVVKKIDIAIIGAGSAGLACAITARQCAPDKSVLILEKLPRTGGLCIASQVGNFKFEVGCNQPPNGFKQVLQNLGIDQQFLSRANECVFEDGTVLRSPFNLRTILSFLSYPVSSVKFFRRAFWHPDNEMLSSITHGLNPKFAHRMQASFSYPILSPDINLSLLRMLITNSSHPPQIPIDGMAKVAEKMQERFLSLGGDIAFNSTCSAITVLPGGKKLVTTTDGRSYETDAVVSSVDALKLYPPTAQPGFAMTTLLFAVKNDLKYPKGIHTIAFLPNNFMEWMRQINLGGAFPQKFGFHCFINSLPEQNGCYTISAYILTPRGLGELTPKEANRIKSYVKAKIEFRIHGFEKALVEEHLLSPAEYVRQFGLTNKTPPLVPPIGFIPPCEANGVHFIGDSSTGFSSVLAAVNSGIKMAEKLFRVLQSSPKLG